MTELKILRVSKVYGSGITLRNNDIINIIKVIRSLENRKILLKGTTGKTIGHKEIIKFSWSIREIWFTINEKCTYRMS